MISSVLLPLPGYLEIVIRLKVFHEYKNPRFVSKPEVARNASHAHIHSHTFKTLPFLPTVAANCRKSP